jgi:hypothetical protein
MRFAGIDLGKSGGIVIIENGDIIFKTIMPVITSTKKSSEYDVGKIVDIFKDYHPDITYIEKPLLHPMSGKKSYQETGIAFGLFRGILSALKLSYDIISPQRWQKNIFAGMNYKDTKQASIMLARRYCPEINWLATERSIKYHDGMTDAFCIALYCKRLNHHD